MPVDGTTGSLELNPFEPQPLEPAQRDRATRIFNQIVSTTTSLYRPKMDLTSELLLFALHTNTHPHEATF
jgi:hypothetical protein